MATSVIPDELRDLFEEPTLAHVSYLNGKGQIMSWPMWVDYDGEHLLISSPVGSQKGRSFRERPQVAISIVSAKNPFHWLSVSGRVVGIRPDEDLAFIDRMSQKYVGTGYQRRSPREIFTVAIDRVSPSTESSARWSRSS
ncbi:pyridoxamine 5'-phosphate oxidase family protein [Candidatus Nephthysia bennettiae]|uniref:Pyridoxamine 5'-phosphate oxidase family protein n=1 Tax=Candidatus Nephthysia bennettiae TaxID=3127016 RepID=A0A934NCW0_9BACT|nr:pyridoxamine 5'-phosphate oxidase family protein [Candidatus Dormibacteraeota bacterium]MBJ7611491.1 pyridoxamine 5'-phosphate oxidase family protein [Candidatus Dormibacteraeota bacterium]